MLIINYFLQKCRSAKREAKEGKKNQEETNKLDVQEPITLDFITNPNKDK